MTPEQEKQWREEFENEFDFVYSETFYPDDSYFMVHHDEGYYLNKDVANDYGIYLLARKKAQEEILDIEKRYEKTLEVRHEYERKIEIQYEKIIDEKEKLISQLKEELKRERSAVDFCAKDLTHQSAELARQTQKQRRIDL